MKAKKLPDWNYVNERLDFNPDTGDITWKYVKPRSSVKIGDSAGYIGTLGYRAIKLDKKLYMAHRLMYFKFNPDFDQKNYIDHRDGIKTNNALNNLREVTTSQNCMNRTLRSNNSSGHKNISKSIKDTGKRIHHYWRVIIYDNLKSLKSVKRPTLEDKLFPYTDEGLQDAIEFRDIKLKQHFGEYSRVE